MVKTFFILISFGFNWYDVTVDSKGRIFLLSMEDRIVRDLKGDFSFPIESMFAPNAISASSFSIWVTSISEKKSQRYSLWGELIGEINIGGFDIDVDEKRVLIAGEKSYLIDLSSGINFIISHKEMKRCALFKDSLFLYGKDTIYIFDKKGILKRKKFIPQVKDICLYNKELCFLFEDSLIIGETIVPVFKGKRVEGKDSFISILTDTGVVYYPSKKQ
ncbi:MAG: hypothetical protein ABIN61_03880 [candidate division WOR-3 bacterium]